MTAANGLFNATTYFTEGSERIWISDVAERPHAAVIAPRAVDGLHLPPDLVAFLLFEVLVHLLQTEAQTVTVSFNSHDL